MNQGAGSALLKEGCSYLRERRYKRAILWVVDTNEKTRKWYENRGWTIEGAAKIDQRDGFEVRELRYQIEL
jgi:ribosomal protein S18 acetylase RimI-like enzyme